MAAWQSRQDAYYGDWSTGEWCDCGGGSSCDNIQMLHDIQHTQHTMQGIIEVAVAEAKAANSILIERVAQLEADKKFEKFAEEEFRKQSYMLTELWKMLSAQHCVVRVPGTAVAPPAASSPRRSSRLDRPRSSSTPPPCTHHNVGNTCTGASVDGYALDVVTSASAAGPWWSHIAAVLLYDKAPLGDALWAWLDVNLGKGRIELRHYFTPKVRHFILVCTCCGELFFMCYDKHLTDEVKNDRVNDLAAFTHCTDALKRKGSCPRLQSDNLHRILK